MLKLVSVFFILLAINIHVATEKKKSSPLSLLLCYICVVLQLRVARAFRSILDDSEFQSSQGSVSNHCSWPVLDEIRIDGSTGATKQQSLSAQNCSYPPLRQASLENHHPQRTLSFKSKSADNVLFDV